MADKVNKSKPFEMGNATYVTTVTNGEISSISVIDSNNNYKPVIPGTDIFNEAASNENSLDALSISKTGSTGNVSETILQNREQLDENYNRLKKSYDNGQFISAAEVQEITSISTDDSSKTKNKIPILFRYPYDIDTNQDHLKIVQYEYKRPDKREFNASSPNKYGTVISDKNKPYGKYNGSVLLPMPKVSDSNGAEWGKSDLNVFGIAAGGLASDVFNDLDQGQPLGSNALDSLSSKIFGNEALDAEDQDTGFLNRIRANIVKNQNNLGNTAAAGLAIGAQELSKLAGINLSADEFLARATGEILNPNAELLFQGPVLRDFGFKFLMIARSPEEAAMIRDIIRFFKVGAAPRFLDGPALLGTPNVFQLEYRAGNKTLNTVNRFNEMALRTITVDYAPDGFWSAYQDSHPVAIVMSLQFSELRPLYSRDHESTVDGESLVGSVGY